MIETKISFETSKLLKEIGFHWKHLTTKLDIPQPDFPSEIKGLTYKGIETRHNDCYNDEGKEICPKYYNPNNFHYPAPSQSLLAKWLREEHNIHVTPVPVIPFPTLDLEKLIYHSLIIFNEKSNREVYYIEDPTIMDFKLEEFEIYEEAMEEGLLIALKKIKNEKISN